MDFAILGTHPGSHYFFSTNTTTMPQVGLTTAGYLLTFVLGYEIQGAENLPANGPALIIYYHGAIPIDIYYFLAKIYLTRNRIVHTVADHFLFKIPGKNAPVM